MHYLISMACSLLLLLSCGSAVKNSAPDEHHQYLALGDSYTIGESVGASETYPQQLVDALNAKGEDFAPPKIIARTGWTTADLQQAIAGAKIKGKKYDLVSLLIGVNNQFQGRSIDEFEREFSILLDQAIGFAKDKKSVFVLSIPDYGYTPFGQRDQQQISGEIDQFNEVVKRVTESKQVTFVDITPISRRGLAEPELVARDGLHPSGKMYEEFVLKIMNYE